MAATSFKNIAFMTVVINLRLFFRLICAVVFYLIRWLISHCPWAPGQLVSSNFYLDKNGKPNIGDNLLISFDVQGLINVAKLKERVNDVWLQENSSSFPQLRQQIVIWFGYPFWRKYLNFDIDDHFSTIASVNLSDEKKCIELERDFLLEKFHLKGKSPWKVGIFLDTKAKCSKVLFKIHHSLGDGISMYGLLMKVADDYIQIQPPPRLMPRPLTSPVHRSLCLRLPGDLDLVKFFLECGSIPQLNIPSDKMSIERHIGKSQRISMKMLKVISAQHQVPLTAVLLAGISGALHNFVKRVKGQGQEIPKFIFCPMPVRLPGQEANNETLDNHVEMIALKLPVGEPNFLKRLFLCKESLDNSLTSQFPLLVGLEGFIMNAYPIGWGDFGFRPPQVVISSFPGPSSQISFLGGENVVTDMHFNRLGCQRFPLMFTTLSYNGGIRIILSADTSIFQSQESVDYFINQLRKNSMN